VTGRLPERTSSNALLIGASRFANREIEDLPAVANNVDALAKVLVDPASGIFDRKRCFVLTDPRTQREVGAALDATVKAATDTVIVYYAGHGLLTRRGELYLAAVETDPRQMIYTAAPMEWLRRALAESPARNRILILDCCFSGRAAEAQTTLQSAVAAATDITGTYTLTSAPANATSIAEPGAQFTVFTGELLQLLRDGIPHASRLLSLRDIYPALIRRLRARGMPEPQHLGTGQADLIALAVNAAAQTTAQESYEPKLRIRELKFTPSRVAVGDVAKLTYLVDADTAQRRFTVALGASLLSQDRKEYYDIVNDVTVELEAGTREYQRMFRVPPAPDGIYRLIGAVWLGEIGDRCLDRFRIERAVTIASR
jgi:hypothetical protein